MVQALRFAAAAGDRLLGAEILAAMSHQAAYLRAGSEAVDLARSAARAAGCCLANGTGSPLIRASRPAGLPR
jgi:hypothetical protein